MKKLTKKLFVLFMSCSLFVFFGCKVDDETKGVDAATFFKNMDSAPELIVAQSNFPEWLSIKILEISEMGLLSESFGAKIFKGEWKNRIVYFIRHSYQSCLFCDIFYEDGEHLVWQTADPLFDNFCATSKNWVLVFKFGGDVLPILTKSGLYDEKQVQD